MSQIQVLHLATTPSSELKVTDRLPPSVALMLYGAGSEDPRSKTEKKKIHPWGELGSTVLLCQPLPHHHQIKINVIVAYTY